MKKLGKLYFLLVLAALTPQQAVADAPPPNQAIVAFVEMNFALSLDDKCHVLSEADHHLIGDSLDKMVTSKGLVGADKQKAILEDIKKRVGETKCDNAKEPISAVLEKTIGVKNAVQWHNYMTALALDKKCTFTDVAVLNQISAKKLQVEALIPEKFHQGLVTEENKTIAKIDAQAPKETCSDESKSFVLRQVAITN